MAKHFLQQQQWNAIVVGNGAIGTALAECLLQHAGLRQLVVLQRSHETSLSDPRVTIEEFDAEQPDTVTAAAATVRTFLQRAHLMINTVGMLHNAQQQPEKRLRSLEPANLQKSFTINAILLPTLVQAFGGLLRHDDPAIFASLSARVGSIEDNHLGGWYSYRASKAAHCTAEHVKAAPAPANALVFQARREAGRQSNAAGFITAAADRKRTPGQPA